VEETPTTIDVRSQDTETRIDHPGPARGKPAGDDTASS